eukprot:maker-scaffold_2-snap-gene-17.53-mRNA-1 protein AED:0.58 eAED:1.00 QI:0/0/0/1/0/0/2/0/69
MEISYIAASAMFFGIVRRLEHSHLKYQDVFNEDFSDEFSNTILTKPTSLQLNQKNFIYFWTRVFLPDVR